MISNRKNILIKAYIVCFGIVLIALGITYKLFSLQLNPQEKSKFIEFAERTNFREAIIPAQRGNLYATDGSLLATSVEVYDVGIDAVSMRKGLINTYLNQLADSLHIMFGKSTSHYSKLILKSKKAKIHYVPIAIGLNRNQVKRLAKFPIFNQGQIRGGLVIDSRIIRKRSIKDLGYRTIGYVRVDSAGIWRKVGLEAAYDSLLAGKNGKRLEQRMGGGNWKPINVNTEINAKNGYDVVTTIDIGLQNVAYNALYKQLSDYEADHGCVVIMEVKTGEVKAIVNLNRLRDGSYADIKNFAVSEANEPGSTIKTISLLAALKDGVIDTATYVQTGKGSLSLFGRTIYDTHANGSINVTQVLAKSSNIGTARLITSVYQKEPEKFLDIITKDWKMEKPLGVDIPGEATPYFPNPENKYWSKQSLSSVSFGYESKITPLQLLTFYNGIANNGTMLKPLFMKEIRNKGKLIKKFDSQVRVAKMAQDTTIVKIQRMLAAVVKEGTGKSLYNPNFPAAGKTGTARAEYWKEGPLQYRASFCGYFPTNNPRYSCIVVIHKPSKKKGFYASSVAGPVFKKIMDYVYTNTPKLYIPENPKINKKIPNNHFELKSNIIPDLKGKIGYKVIPVLENAGLKVTYSGIGKIIKQSLPAGTIIKKGSNIQLELSN